MAGSVFGELAFKAHAGGVEVRCPSSFHNTARARALGRAYGVDVGDEDGVAWTVRAAAVPGAFPGALKAFFAELSGFPAPYPGIAEPGPASPAPMVTCIVVVNQNALFVREQLLPALYENTRSHAFEVVLVHNGLASAAADLGAFGAVRSPFGAVSAAYNAGAALARGRYLAFFHDDCIVDDPRWVDKCLALLAQGVAAVAGEFRRLERIAGVSVPAVPVAKCVPLFISAAEFARAGRFDEFHYVGYEDLDLTLRLAQLGRRVERVDLDLRHFDGMSSTLKYCPISGLESLYAMTAVPRWAILRRFREFAAQGLRRDGVDYLRLALDAQLFHVLMKHRDYLATIDRNAYAKAADALASVLQREAGVDPAAVVPRFKALDREFASSARAAA